jgi:2,3-bisphosphoglycerate-independent phosphoglycerate mutase
MSRQLKSPFALVIVDGWGISQNCERNAFFLAHTPNFDALEKSFGRSELHAAGESVGLLADEPGQPDAGHLVIGAGRIIESPAARIASAISSGEFFNNEVLTKTISAVKSNGRALHLMGLLSDAGIHSSVGTLFALLKLAKIAGVENVYVHPILDGHDVAPRTADVYLEALEVKMNEIGVGRIATVCGRHFAMDTSGNWGKTARVFTMLAHSEGERASDAVSAVRSSFLRGITDEFIAPIVIESQTDLPVATISDGDAIIFFNHKADGMRQLAFTLAASKRENGEFRYNIVTMVEYDPSLNVPAAFEPNKAIGGFGFNLAEKRIRNVRFAETERFQHITAFLGSKGLSEDDAVQNNVLISRRYESIHQSDPEMGSFKLADKFIAAIESEPETFLIANLSAADLMASTGDLEKTIEAVQFIDTCVGGMWEAIRRQRGTMIITSSHGNFEDVRPLSGGPVRAAGTRNRVPFIIAGEELRNGRVRPEGSLADIAPTVFQIIGLEPPETMSGCSLIDQ